MADKKSVKQPTIQTLMRWEAQGKCKCSGPCKHWVEPDGRCENGYSSWLIVMGLI